MKSKKPATKSEQSAREASAVETNRYKLLIEKIFFDHWKKGATEFEFVRDEIKRKADELKIELPDNLGDITYSFRAGLRCPNLSSTPSRNVSNGSSREQGAPVTAFGLVHAVRIRPREDMAHIAVPDATPELIRAYALDDEQALLAIVRYNRLIDTFLGLTTYSLQNHLRTTVKGIGQIEIDELYIGLDKRGCHYVIPVQAKGGKDQIGVVQATQDIRWVEQKFPGMRCRAIAAQFAKDGVIALFELTLKGQEVKIVDERHYQLVPADELNQDAIRNYREP